jgi:hypothetical protein
MPNTGERREITKRVNAKEAEMVSSPRNWYPERERSPPTQTRRTWRAVPERTNGDLPQSVTQPARGGNSKKRNPTDESSSSARLR